VAAIVAALDDGLAKALLRSNFVTFSQNRPLSYGGPRCVIFPAQNAITESEIEKAGNMGENTLSCLSLDAGRAEDRETFAKIVRRYQNLVTSMTTGVVFTL
jgi:hypothetical protein